MVEQHGTACACPAGRGCGVGGQRAAPLRGAARGATRPRHLAARSRSSAAARPARSRRPSTSTCTHPRREERHLSRRPHFSNLISPGLSLLPDYFYFVFHRIPLSTILRRAAPAGRRWERLRCAPGAPRGSSQGRRHLMQSWGRGRGAPRCLCLHAWPGRAWPGPSALCPRTCPASSPANARGRRRGARRRGAGAAWGSGGGGVAAMRHPPP